MSGWKDWQIGEVVTEGEFQSFIQDQVVQVYANASARDSALGGNVATGMVAYLTETDEYQVYNSVGEWVAVGAGTISSVIAGTALTGGGTEGDVTLNVDLSAVTIPTSQISDITATAAELNILDGATVTAAALNTIGDGTQGFTALSNGTAGISYQPVSHNYIINGAFDIWQRGTTTTNSAAGTLPSAADRFVHNRSTVSQVAFSSGELNSLGVDNTKFYARVANISGANSVFGPRIENAETLAGRTVTFSFYAKASSNTQLMNLSLDQLWNGTSDLNRTNFSNPPLITTSWQRYSRTATLVTSVGETITATSFIFPFMRIPDGATVDVWGWQLEAGSVATPFKRHAPSLQGELAACQRYFVRFTHPVGLFAYCNSFNLTTGEARGAIQLPVQMREAPTSVITSGISSDYSILTAAGNQTCSSVPALQGATKDTVFIRFFSIGNLTVGQGSTLRSNNADLAFDRDL